MTSADETRLAVVADPQPRDGERDIERHAKLRTATADRDRWWKIRLFSGIANDLRRRSPYYASDWKDAWDYRVVPATIYMYFAKYVALNEDSFPSRLRLALLSHPHSLLLVSSEPPLSFGERPLPRRVWHELSSLMACFFFLPTWGPGFCFCDSQPYTAFGEAWSQALRRWISRSTDRLAPSSHPTLPPMLLSVTP